MNPDFLVYPDDPRWLRVLAFLQALGAPTPTYEEGFRPPIAMFRTFRRVSDKHPKVTDCVYQGHYVGLAVKAPGVTVNDLLRVGLVRLREGVRGVPAFATIEELEKMLPELRAEPQ